MDKPQPFTRNPFGTNPADPFTVNRLGTQELAALMAEKMGLVADRLLVEHYRVTIPTFSGVDPTERELILPNDTKGAIRWELIQATFMLDCSAEAANVTALRLYQDITGGARIGMWVSNPANTQGGFSLHYYAGSNPSDSTLVPSATPIYHNRGPACAFFDPSEKITLTILGPASAISAYSPTFLFRKIKLY